MADKQYPAQGNPSPNNPPPPAYGYVPPPASQQPPPAGAQANVVVVEKKPEKKKGFFSSLKAEADKIGKTISKELDYAGAKINEAVDKNYSSMLMDMFGNGNVVQLISRQTGRTVEIVMNAAGQMVIDANGPCDPNAFNSLWTVVNEGNNQIRLQNYNNFMAIENGSTVVKTQAPGTPIAPTSKFQLSQIASQFITLESLTERGRHVGFMPGGELKLASSATVKDQSVQMGVKLVSTAYPVVNPPKN